MVRIVTDTTAGLQSDVAQREGIVVVPQIIVFGDEELREGIDIDAAGFLARLRVARDLPKTSAPPPQLFAEAFAQLAPSGEAILCLHPSALVSGTVRSASIAAADCPGCDIRVIDTGVVGSLLGTMVQLACGWAKEGLDADAIAARIRELTLRARLYFVVATLEFLARGGRIGGATAFLGTMLQVKPILALHQGQVEPYARERTHKRAIARLKRLVLDQAAPGGEAYPAVMHAGVPREGQALAAELATALNLPAIPVLDVPPAIATHSGPGALAVSFFTAEGRKGDYHAGAQT